MATCNRSLLIGLTALPYKIGKPRRLAAARPWQRSPSTSHNVANIVVESKTKDFSTITSNPGKDGGPWDENIDAQNMLYLRRRIEDLKSEELRMQAQEESQYMLYLRRRIEHLKSREVMMQEKEESQLDDIHMSYSNVESEKWMKWERDYQMFYQEEVCFMMAHIQEWLLQCRPSLFLTMLLGLCIAGTVGTFYLLSSFLWSLLFPTVFFIWAQSSLFHECSSV